MYKLMIVEDETVIRRGLVQTIDWGQMGFEVIADAENGQKALEAIGRECPDVIMTDIRMPIMDGLELMSTVNRMYPQISMVVLSGYGDFSYAQHAISCGVLGYILKPTKDADIIEAFAKVKSVLDGTLGREEPKPLKQIARSQDPIIAQVKEYIDTHFSDRVSLEDVARIAHMNPTYFSTYFKQKSGESFKDYLVGVRMENAKALALQTDLTSYSIAMMVGYDDARHFSKLFKNTFGKSIAELRREGMG